MQPSLVLVLAGRLFLLLLPARRGTRIPAGTINISRAKQGLILTEAGSGSFSTTFFETATFFGAAAFFGATVFFRGALGLSSPLDFFDLGSAGESGSSISSAFLFEVLAVPSTAGFADSSLGAAFLATPFVSFASVSSADFFAAGVFAGALDLVTFDTATLGAAIGAGLVAVVFFGGMVDDDSMLRARRQGFVLYVTRGKGAETALDKWMKEVSRSFTNQAYW